MTVEKTQVKVDVQGEAPAAAAAARLEKRAEDVERKARVAKELAEEAEDALPGRRGSLNSRFGRLLKDAKKKGVLKEEGFAFAGLEISRSGVRIEEEALKGKRNGYKVMRGVFVSGVTGHAIGNTLNRVADVRDLIEEYNFTGIDALHEVGLQSARGIHSTFGSESILTGVLRLSGERRDVIEDAFDRAFSRTGLTDVDAQIAAQAAARRQFLKNFPKMLEAENRAKLKKREAREEALEIVDRELARRYAAVRVSKLPVEVPDSLFEEMRAERQRLEVARAKEQKRKINAGVGS